MDFFQGPTKNDHIVGEMVNHCLIQAFTQTPYEAFANKIIVTDVKFNNFDLKAIIRVYNAFMWLRIEIERCARQEYEKGEEDEEEYFESANRNWLSIIYIIQLDDNLYYLFNLLFNFYNDTVGKEEEDLSNLRKTNRGELGFLDNYGCSEVHSILVNNFKPEPELTRETTNFNFPPLYGAIVAVGYWCYELIIDIKSRLHSTMLDLLDKKSVDFSYYNNNIANEELNLLTELTLHKMDKEIDSKLKYGNNGISIIDDKINYTLKQLVFNYNQIHKIITGQVTKKLKQCAINELQAHYNENRMDVSNKITKISKNNICIQCKTREPIFYEAQSAALRAENNNENKFCTKICQMKFHNYII
jgi:hypothetical protein